MFKTKFFTIVRKHYTIIILAFVVGLLTLLPQLIAVRDMGSDFQGIYPINGSDDLYYLARLQEVKDGHPLLANPYLYEYKDVQPLQFWVPDFVVASFSILFGGNVFIANYVLDFILPFLLVLLTYSCLFALTKDKRISLVGSFFLHVGIFLALFGRPVSPQLIFVFCLTLSYFIIKYFQDMKGKWLLFSVLNFAILFYTYTYHWTFYTVLFGLFMFFSIFFLKKQSITQIKGFLFVLVGGALLGIPYFLQLMRSANLEGYSDTMIRLGMLDTHFPSGFAIVGISGMLFIALVVLYKKKLIQNIRMVILLLSAILTPAIVTNHHLITGKNLEFSSHYWPISVFWFVFVGAYLFHKFVSSLKSDKIKRILILLVSAGIIVFSSVSAWETIKRHSSVSESELVWQEYSDILYWLGENTEKDDVVWAREGLQDLIPIYTHDNVLFSRFSNLHFMTSDEVWNRFVLNHYWDVVDEAFIKQHERSIWGTQYINGYGHKLGRNRIRQILGFPQVENVRLPDSAIDDFMSYAQDYQNKDLGEMLKKYRIDYIVLDKRRASHWRIGDIEYKEIMMEDNRFIVYKLKLQ